MIEKIGEENLLKEKSLLKEEMVHKWIQRVLRRCRRGDMNGMIQEIDRG